jgi:2-oxoglutarate/2-oxoacid ferredoxin oxidoreductase subunit beta
MSQDKPRRWNDYRSDLAPVWCPGCGDYSVVAALYRSLAELQVPNEDLAIISGIGCSSRLPGYVNAFGFNTIHGRAIPVATGLKTARPDTTVIAVGGDGDGFSIGGGHLPHVARRNVDMTYIIMDNRIYGLTKGQTSPTTPEGERTATSRYGWPETPANPISLALAYGMSFVAQSFAGDIKGLTKLITQAVRWPGFAFIEVHSPCVTYRGKEQYKLIRERAVPVPEDHDTGDRAAAFQLADDPDHLYLGVLFQREGPTFDQRLGELRVSAREAGRTGFGEAVRRFAV